MAHQRMADRLAEAQRGDKRAQEEVALYVYERFQHRICKLTSLDPSLDREDLEACFMLGIYEAVLIADGRGDDFYHIGQRGVWHVLSQIKKAKAVMDGRAWKAEKRAAIDPEVGDLFEREDPAEGDFRELVMDRIGAEEVARVIVNAPLKPRAREALEVILDGHAGDPDEPGFNLRLARHMAISPQRASQLMAAIREGLA